MCGGCVRASEEGRRRERVHLAPRSTCLYVTSSSVTGRFSP